MDNIVDTSGHINSLNGSFRCIHLKKYILYKTYLGAYPRKFTY